MPTRFIPSLFIDAAVLSSFLPSICSHEAGRGPNPDAARLDAELEAYRSAKAAAAAAAAAPAAGMDADAAGTA